MLGVFFTCMKALTCIVMEWIVAGIAGEQIPSHSALMFIFVFLSAMYCGYGCSTHY